MHHGRVIKTTGDGIYAAFDDAAEGLNAAIAIQQSVADPAATAGMSLPVRCGLHAGPAHERDNDFFGGTINRAARIMGLAYGGQVLASQAVADLVAGRLPAESSLRDLGDVRLRGIASSEHAYQVVHPSLRQEFPALRSLEATPNNLPKHPTSFIGREREIEEAEQLLQPRAIIDIAWHRRPRQDPPRAADRGRCPGVLSRWLRGSWTWRPYATLPSWPARRPRSSACGRSPAGRSSKRFARI
jgi:hypothetical protein